MSLYLSSTSVENYSKSEVKNYTSSINFFKSTVKFSGYSNIYKNDSRILACYDRFKCELVILKCFFLIRPTNTTCNTTSRFLELADLNIALLATKCSIMLISASALALLNFKKYFPLSARNNTKVDNDEYKYSYTNLFIYSKRTVSFWLDLLYYKDLMNNSIGIRSGYSIDLMFLIAMVLMNV